MAPKKVNPKAVAALDKQALLQQERERKAALEAERSESAAWEVGADARGAAKQKELEEKAAAKAALKAQKDALLAEEEAQASSGGKKPSKPKKKGKDDLDFLNEALANAPKSKAQKQAEEKKKADDERKAKDAQDKLLRDEKKVQDELVRKQAAARGIVMDHGDSLMVENTNRIQSEFEDVSGLDAALDLLSTNDTGIDQHPEKRQKALYNAYYERMLPQVKQDFPGLRLSQYKDKIFEMWTKSPENPMRK